MSKKVKRRILMQCKFILISFLEAMSVGIINKMEKEESRILGEEGEEEVLQRGKLKNMLTKK